jgi:hypothetical protein
VGGLTYQQNAQAITARELWLRSFALPKALGAEPLGPEVLAEQLRQSLGVRNLLALELGDDILAAAKWMGSPVLSAAAIIGCFSLNTMVSFGSRCV